MTQQDALYRAVCEHPDEDTPRLVFADWLEENGDARRAAFVRTQVALSRVPEYDPLWAACRRRDPDAIRGWTLAHTLPRLPTGFSWRRFRFHRGFPDHAAVTSIEHLFRNANALFATAPIQGLELDHDSGASGQLARIAELPALARLRRIEFVNTAFTGGMSEFVRSPFAGNLAELSFEGHAIEADALAALASSPLFERLTRFELRLAALTPALVVDALAAAPAGLRELVLGECKLPAPDIAHLLQQPICESLRSLDLSLNPLQTEGCRALAKSRPLRALEELRLHKSSPGAAGIAALTGEGPWERLRWLDVSANRLGPASVRRIASAFPNLRALSLSHNPIGTEGARFLAEIPHFESLVELDVRGCDLGAEAIGLLTRRFGAAVLLETPARWRGEHL